jgi:PAS domain S-box-containing protein
MKDQSSFLAFALKSILECVSITDIDEKIIFVNEAFLKTYGYEENELIGQPVTMLRSPNNSPEFINKIYPATRKGGWRGELLNLRKDGTEFPVSLATSMIFDDKGKAVAVMGIASDITERKKVEEALRESERRARALLDAIPDLMFRLDGEGTYLDFKAAREDLYVQTGPIIGRKNRDLTPQSFADLIDEKIKKALNTGKMEVFEYELPIKNKGLRIFEARMIASGPNEVTAISRDITERKKAEESLQKKIQELEYFNNLMINRELKMIELKNEINALLKRLGEKEKYITHENSGDEEVIS